MRNWNHQRVLILGAARQGLALARFLSSRGAVVTLNDNRPAEKMTGAIDALKEYPVNWVLGEHPQALLDSTDLVCISGGVPLSLPIVTAAQRKGLPISNDSQIFMESISGKVIGITGSAGKTTTTTLVGRMAKAAVQPPHQVWVGGNIGLPLIDQVDQIQPDDQIILELSSFQLELMTTSPEIAAVLNITPNHLDRHGTLEAYTAAKARILDFQNENGTAVLGHEDPGAWSLSNHVRGRLVTFGFDRSRSGLRGTYLDGSNLALFDGEQTQKILPSNQILLRGRHNLLNVLAACAIAYAMGLPAEAMTAGIEGFAGVPHRLEFVRDLNGVKWYNDSIATAPERTMAALRSFREPMILLLGGRDKDLPWDKLADMVHAQVDHVVLFGEAAVKIQTAMGPLQNGSRPYTMVLCSNLQEAVQAAHQVAEAGDVILLSPGGTSYDEFNDFEERGEQFRSWVKQLT